MPSLCPMTCDPERDVRDQAFKVIKNFLTKLEKVSEDPSLKESMEADVDANASPNVADVASTWAGWAVSAVTSKFHKTPDSKVAESGAAAAVSSGVQSATSETVSVKTTSNVGKSAATAATEDHESDAESNNWDSSNWGNMTSVESKSTTALAAVIDPSSKETDGWEVDEDEWAPLEDVKAPAVSDFTPVSTRDVKSIASYQWDAPSLAASKQSHNITSSASDWDSNWEGNNWSADGAGMYPLIELDVSRRHILCFSGAVV